MQLVEAAFGKKYMHAAVFLDVRSEATVRGWYNKGAFWPAQAEEFVKEFGLAVTDLDVVEEDWKAILDSIRDRFAKASPYASLGWAFSGGQVDVREEVSDSERQIVLITCDLRNDTQIAPVWKMVEKNLKKGVDYLYVVPSNSDNLVRFRQLVDIFRKAHAGQPGVGIVRIMRVPREQSELEWRFIDHVLLRLSKSVDRSTIGSVDLSDVEHCFEQIYQAGDMISDGHMWLKMPTRRLNLFLELLTRWEPISEWE